MSVRKVVRLHLLGNIKKSSYLCNAETEKPVATNAATEHKRRKQTHQGAIAQLVEQRTENPCVTGSIPVGTT